MSKYVKILVPDDFEANTVHLNETATATVWEPHYTEVLDHGFVGLVDFYGDDMSIVNSARVSYGKGTKKTRSDRGLIRYLMRHLHTTPFEMVDFKFHVKAPIFVFRQWHRHRTFSINEYSARYSIMTDEMYHPELGHLSPQSSTNRQGRSGDLLRPEEYTVIMEAVDHIYREAYHTYKWTLGPDENGNLIPPPENIRARIDWCKDAAVTAVRESRRRASESDLPDPYPTEKSLEQAIQEYMTQNGVHDLGEDFPGIARELARMVLPVATYSEMYWKGNLHNLFHFLNLRADSHAQHEIQVYARAILDIIQPYVPWAVEAFEDYLLHGVRLSRMEAEFIRDQFQQVNDLFKSLPGRPFSEIVQEKLSEAGASKREIDEFLSKIIS